MTCRACIGYRFCSIGRNEQTNFYGKESACNNVEDLCSAFKNKADFVKIPCKCKDCEHFNNLNPDKTYCEEHSDGWGDNRVYVDEDDYCSFGIRKR